MALIGRFSSLKPRNMHLAVSINFEALFNQKNMTLKGDNDPQINGDNLDSTLAVNSINANVNLNVVEEEDNISNGNILNVAEKDKNTIAFLATVIDEGSPPETNDLLNTNNTTTQSNPPTTDTGKPPVTNPAPDAVTSSTTSQKNTNSSSS
ncbi:anaphase-promoting complex subunit cdh1-like [Pistacia vera]|uniref:anaphase-promoting complex subunit cdh1-like n=1 Tax=Pistacia vera TaxID=55513 RepID=UPI001263BDDA|nr:anaphase-promoting complex subunit cdh1-like [Pistacia vera]